MTALELAHSCLFFDGNKRLLYFESISPHITQTSAESYNKFLQDVFHPIRTLQTEEHTVVTVTFCHVVHAI